MRAEIFLDLRAALEAEEPLALATVVAGAGLGNQLLVWPAGQCRGDLGSPRLNHRAALYAEQALAGGASGRKGFHHEEGEVEVFFELLLPSPRLVIVGAVHVAVPLVALARRIGFRTLVVDPRPALLTRERFAEADELVCAWPDRALAEIGLDARTYLAVLAHDPKLDLPALEAALRAPLPYIGALGSKKTHDKRISALTEKGFDRRQIERIHSPIGLDLGGRRAEEIALAVLAQIVAVRHRPKG